MQKQLQDLVKSLSEKHGFSKEEIENIIETPYRFATEVMERGNKEEGVYCNVRILGLGVFHVVPGRIYHLKRTEEKNIKNKDFRFSVDPVKQKKLQKEIEKELLNKRKGRKSKNGK